MQRLEVSGAVRSIYGSLGVKRLIQNLFLGTGTYRRLFPARHIRRTELDLIYIKSQGGKRPAETKRSLCLCWMSVNMEK